MKDTVGGIPRMEGERQMKDKRKSKGIRKDNRWKGEDK
jgi:hypothetical protein